MIYRTRKRRLNSCPQPQIPSASRCRAHCGCGAPGRSAIANRENSESVVLYLENPIVAVKRFRHQLDDMKRELRGRKRVDKDLLPRRWPTLLAPIAPVEYLEAALAFASNHNLGMPIAKLDLSNRTAGCVYLPENYCRVDRTSRCSARRRVAASPDLNSRRRGIEVRFEHRLVSVTLSRPMPVRTSSFG